MNQMLVSLMTELYQNPTDSDFQQFAEMVSKTVGKEPAWGYKYMKGCYHGYKNISVSRQLARALQILANRLDGQSIIQARAREITCLTINGVVEGSVILGHTKYCKWCHIPFVGTPKRLYCCDEHGRLFRAEKRRQQRREKWKVKNEA